MNVIETHKLTKYYGKDRGILDLDLEIREGEIFGFIGPNGAGKSTTIRTLLGLIFPSSGSGKIFGWDIVRESREIKRLIGFMPSDVNYYEKMDVGELLRYSAAFYGVDCEARIAELAEAFALDLDRKILDLSQGNKKKVTILQSLIHRPRLLILDEPTSGLDPLMQNTFFDILRQENREGTTVFFSSHTLSEVQKMCRRVGIIKDGRIIAVEDIESLRRKQLRKVEVDFSSAGARDRFQCAGMIAPRPHDHALNFMYAGSMEELIRVLAGQEITDLLIEEPTLEEIFMHYYYDDEDDHDAGKEGPVR